MSQPITKKAFLDRLGIEAIATAFALNDPRVEAFRFYMDSVTEIHLDDPNTLMGIGLLQQLGVIDGTKAADVLAPPVLSEFTATATPWTPEQIDAAPIGTRLVERAQVDGGQFVPVVYRMCVGPGEWQVGLGAMLLDAELTAHAGGANWGNADVLAVGHFDGWAAS